MRWQRVVVFAAIVVAHVLAVLVFPAGSISHESPEQEISFATLMVPEPLDRKTSKPNQQGRAAAFTSRRLAETMRAPRSARTNHADRDVVASREFQPDAASSPAPSIDWAKEAQIAADNRVTQDAEISRQVSALSKWRSQVMPAPKVPERPQFRWDYARTHRLESSALGLNINLNDRCSLLISLYMMAIIGGCKIGEMPAHGDLFTHLKDDPE
jgi:hypothetical protein